MELQDGTTLQLDDSHLAASLQYGSSTGWAPLLHWFKSTIIGRYHENKELAATTSSFICHGSQDGLSKAFDLLVSQDDTVLVELPTYTGVLAALRPLRPKLMGMPCDAEGINTDYLESLLTNWKTSQATKSLIFPKIVHVIPTGHNPTGATLSVNRRRHLLQIASRFDLLILEDDPYYFLYYGRDEMEKPSEQPPPSLYSMDREGRVIRFDSLSKVLSAGMRLGFVTGPKLVVDLLEIHQQTTTMHPSGLSQVVAHTVMSSWGAKKLDAHLLAANTFYKHRRDLCLRYLNENLRDYCEWNVPTGGMFVWLRVKGVDDVSPIVDRAVKKKKIQFMKGNSFFVDNLAPSSYIRMSFSLGSEKQLLDAIQRFAELLREELQPAAMSKTSTSSPKSKL